MYRSSVFLDVNLLFVVLKRAAQKKTKDITFHLELNLRLLWQKEPSFLLGVSGVDLLFGVISRLMLDTRSRNDNAGLGGATGRGNVCKEDNYLSQ